MATLGEGVFGRALAGVTGRFRPPGSSRTGVPSLRPGVDRDAGAHDPRSARTGADVPRRPAPPARDAGRTTRRRAWSRPETVRLRPATRSATFADACGCSAPGWRAEPIRWRPTKC